MRDEEWERKLLKRRWIIPRFYDEHADFLRDFLHLPDYIFVISNNFIYSIIKSANKQRNHSNSSQRYVTDHLTYVQKDLKSIHIPFVLLFFSKILFEIKKKQIYKSIFRSKGFGVRQASCFSTIFFILVRRYKNRETVQKMIFQCTLF